MRTIPDDQKITLSQVFRMRLQTYLELISLTNQPCLRISHVSTCIKHKIFLLSSTLGIAVSVSPFSCAEASVDSVFHQSTSRPKRPNDSIRTVEAAQHSVFSSPTAGFSHRTSILDARLPRSLPDTEMLATSPSAARCQCAPHVSASVELLLTLLKKKLHTCFSPGSFVVPSSPSVAVPVTLCVRTHQGLRLCLPRLRPCVQFLRRLQV